MDNFEKEWHELCLKRAKEKMLNDLKHNKFDKDEFERINRGLWGLNKEELYMVENGVSSEFEKMVANSVNAEKRKELAKQAKKSKQIELSKFADISINEYGDVKKALDLAHKYNDIIDDYKKKSYDVRILRKMARGLAFDIKAIYTRGAKDYLEEAEAWQENYAKVWNKKYYDDPQQELLKRQDIDTKISAMSKDDLSRYIKNKDYLADHLNAYGINKLLSMVKDNDTLYTPLKTYRDENHIGEEYKNSDEWLKVASEKEVAQSYYNLGSKGDHILGAYGENDERNISFNPTFESTQAIGSYDLQSPNQWNEYVEAQKHADLTNYREDTRSKIEVSDAIESE